jgi:hypothetical protein
MRLPGNFLFKERTGNRANKPFFPNPYKPAHRYCR